MNYKKLIPIFLFLFIFLFWPRVILADAGPKESVNFVISYNNNSIPDDKFYAKMLGCISGDLTKYGIQDTANQLATIKQYDARKGCFWYPAWQAFGGNCSNSYCNFGYFPPHDFKLAVYLPSLNKVFISDEIKSNTQFHGNTFTANLTSDGKIVITGNDQSKQETNSSYIELFIGALIITEILELIATLIFVFISKTPKKLKALLFVFIVNLISVPIVWFVFPLFQLGTAITIFVSEIFVFLFEAYFLFFFLKKNFSFRKALLLSFINNLFSMFIGFAMYM